MMMRSAAPLVVLVLLAFVTGTGAHAAPIPEALAARTIATMARGPSWGTIQIAKATTDQYTVILLYKKTPANMRAVERDTMAIARALLKALVAAGHKPADEDILIRVSGRKPEKGETGVDMIVPYGSTRYDPLSDSLTFTDEAIR